MLADLATERLRQCLDDLKPMSGTDVCVSRTVVCDAAFDERPRRQQLDYNRAAAAAKGVTGCICNKLRHDQAKPPTALGIDHQGPLYEHQLDALEVEL